MKLLKGKTAIITGASRGIGKGIAKEFASNGANVAFTFSKSVELAKEFEKELISLGVKAVAYQSDAANYNDSIELVEKIVKDFDSIDILVNNAGITRDNLLMRMQEEDFNQVIKVNLNSVFNMTKAVQKIMLKQRNAFWQIFKLRGGTAGFALSGEPGTIRAEPNRTELEPVATAAAPSSRWCCATQSSWRY